MRTVFITLLLLAVTMLDAQTRLFTIGDSTMAKNTEIENDPNDPGRGWVESLQQYFNEEELIVCNFGASGRSTKSYIAENRWAKVLSEVKEGDIILIQFGHNDEKVKDPARYTAPNGEFKDNLKKFINESRELGAIPILATPIVRRRFIDKSNKLKDTHTGYAEAVRKAAKETHTELVDMEKITKKIVQEYGPEKSKELYLYISPGIAKRFPEGCQDNTHLCDTGAKEFAKAFVLECKRKNNSLSKYVKLY